MRWLQLLKMRISLSAAVSSFTGYILHSHKLETNGLVLSIGVFVLACGAGAMNHFQDRFVDGLFSRTNQRPLPRKLIAPPRVLFFSACLILIGLAVIYFSRDSGPALSAGIAAVILYNGLYTPLKKRTNLAMIPGVLCGMMPPFIGWVAVDGEMVSPKIIILMALWGLWQLPHFWLLLLKNQKEYRESDLPNMLAQFTELQLKRILLVWIFGFVCTALLLPVTGVLISPWSHWFLAAGLFFMIVVFGYLLLPQGDFQNESHLFRCLNYTMGLVIALIIVDRLTLLSF